MWRKPLNIGRNFQGYPTIQNSKSKIQNSICALSLLVVACALIWYAVCSNRIAAEDLDFIRRHDSTRFFPKALYYRGVSAYYDELDPLLAARYYRRAIEREPTFIPAWLALAKVELMDGHRQEAGQIMGDLNVLVARVSTWKWQELLLANDLGDDAVFAECLNFIFERLPYRIPEAYYLAVNYWGDAARVVPHIAAQNRPAFMAQLMREKEVDASLILWKTMRDGPDPVDPDLKLRFCQFLLANNRLSEAGEVWQSWLGRSQAGIHDGDFQEEPLNMGFGWRLSRSPQVSVKRTSETSYEGSHSLNVHFNGTGNVNFYHVSQIVPVQPGTSYVLRFAEKSRNLTTDQGVFLEVIGYQCKGLHAATEPISGTTRWTAEELHFSVPEGCHAVAVRVRRKESLMFDNKIAGDYWLDAVRLALPNS